jgi:hypothetical protein
MFSPSSLLLAALIASSTPGAPTEPVTQTATETSADAAPSVAPTGSDAGRDEVDAPERPVAASSEVTPREAAPAAAAAAGPRRKAGDTNIILAPSARSLREGETQVNLDQLLLWRVAWGISDKLDLEFRTAWVTSLGLGAKYTMLNHHRHKIALHAGADALIFSKRYNAQQASLIYTLDERRGAWHLGVHAIRLQRRLSRDESRIYNVGQATMGAEVELGRITRALFEASYGQDRRHVRPEENTGFMNVGLRVGDRRAFIDAALVVPISEAWWESEILGIPFFRIGLVH